MSVVNEFKDPMSGKVNHFAKGAIKFVSIKPVRGADADGVKRTHIAAKNGQPAKVIEATHTISVLMVPVDENNNVVDANADGEWVSMGEKKLHANHTDKVQVKFDSGYKDILPGMVVSFPLKVSTGKDGKTYYNGTLSGKLFNILDESKATQPAARTQGTGSSQNASGASSASSGKTTKVFGEITAVSGLEATVKTDNGPVVVKLTDEQRGQIQVGGRLAGQRGQDGTIASGFKAYGPAGQGGSQGGTGKGKDMSGMETGHAINGALNLRRNGLTVAPTVHIAKVVHDVTKHLKQEVKKDPAHKGMSDYDAGAMVGHAVLNATRDIEVSDSDNPETVTQKLLDYSRALMSEVVPDLTAYIRGENLQQEAKSTPEPNLQQPQASGQKTEEVKENGHVNYAPPPMDFDDDIPF